MQEKFGETALITASTNGHLETAQLLLQKGASINYQRKVSVVAMWMVDMVWPGTEWCAQFRAIKVASRLGHLV